MSTASTNQGIPDFFISYTENDGERLVRTVLVGQAQGSRWAKSDLEHGLAAAVATGIPRVIADATSEVTKEALLLAGVSGQGFPAPDARHVIAAFSYGLGKSVALYQLHVAGRLGRRLRRQPRVQELLDRLQSSEHASGDHVEEVLARGRDRIQQAIDDLEADPDQQSLRAWFVDALALLDLLLGIQRQAQAATIIHLRHLLRTFTSPVGPIHAGPPRAHKRPVRPLTMNVTVHAPPRPVIEGCGWSKHDLLVA
jgi:hypothetical protein